MQDRMLPRFLPSGRGQYEDGVRNVSGEPAAVIVINCDKEVGYTELCTSAAYTIKMTHLAIQLGLNQ